MRFSIVEPGGSSGPKAQLSYGQNNRPLPVPWLSASDCISMVISRAASVIYLRVNKPLGWQLYWFFIGH